MINVSLIILFSCFRCIFRPLSGNRFATIGAQPATESVAQLPWAQSTIQQHMYSPEPEPRSLCLGDSPVEVKESNGVKTELYASGLTIVRSARQDKAAPVENPVVIFKADDVKRRTTEQVENISEEPWTEAFYMKPNKVRFSGASFTVLKHPSISVYCHSCATSGDT